MRTLLIFYLQNDFCSFGNMETPGADALIEKANSLMPLFDEVFAINLAFPPNHISFAANHLFRQPGKTMIINGREQMLRPIHCVEGSFGAEFPKELDSSVITNIVKIGQNPAADVFNAFRDDDGHKTQLENYLKNKEGLEIFIMGIVSNVLINSAIEALGTTSSIFLIKDALANIDSYITALEELKRKGISFLLSDSIV